MADRIGLVHVTPERTQLYPILQRAIPRMWEVFQSAAIVKDWLLDTDSWTGKEPRERTFGDPMEAVR